MLTYAVHNDCSCCQEAGALASIFKTLSDITLYDPSDPPPPGLEPFVNVLVNVATAPADVRKACHVLETNSVLGFDMEWNANRRVPGMPTAKVACVQMSTSTQCFVFPIIHMSNATRSIVAAILEDENITKVGLNCKADATRLRNSHSIQCAGKY
jgi:hypothetical protein